MSRSAARAAKRLADVVGAAVLIVLTLPLTAVVALLIPLKLGPGGVLFRQIRPGFHEVPFQLYKFRSLLDTVDDDGHPRPEGQRLTPFGWFLRKYSIDELPQLWNVLKGEMSLVGPRPLLDEWVQRMGTEFRRRHDVRPGISGWAQVSGRHRRTFKQRLELDLWYVDNWGLALDLRIIMLTALRVLHPVDVEPPDQAAETVDDLGVHGLIEARRKEAD